MPDLVAVKTSVPVCMPAEVVLPRNQTDEPIKARVAVIMGKREDVEPLAVITSPCAAFESAFTTSILIRAPDLTSIVGFTIPEMRNVLSGPPEGLASTTKWSEVPEKVIRACERPTVAPVGTSLPRRAALVELTRAPGALAKSRPMTSPASVFAPIMAFGRSPPRIQPGALVPPIIQP